MYVSGFDEDVGLHILEVEVIRMDNRGFKREANKKYDAADTLLSFSLLSA